MKKTLLVIMVTLAAATAAAVPVFAQKKDYGLDRTVQATGGLLPTSIAGASSVPQLVGTVIAAVLSFLGIVFFLLVFYAGMLWMTARGNDESIERAKSIMEAAVIGLVIILGAYAITQFVFDQLAGRNTVNAPGAATGSGASALKDSSGLSQSDIQKAQLNQQCNQETTKSNCIAPCIWRDTVTAGQAQCYLP